MQKLLNLALAAIIAAMPLTARADAPPDAVAGLRNEWGRIKYAETDRDTQIKDIAVLETKASAAVAAAPQSAEPKIWDAIILATDAGFTKSFSSLSKLKKSKSLLEAALKEDPKALDGSAYTTLGSLYYQVPGWPIGFGNNSKAEENLRQALLLNPDGIDPNYFYGDFLLQNKQYNQALTVLRHALLAKPRPGYEIIDAGRAKEINQDIAQAEKGLANGRGTAAANE